MQASILRGLRSTCHFGEEMVTCGRVFRMFHSVNQGEYLKEVCSSDTDFMKER